MKALFLLLVFTGCFAVAGAILLVVGQLKSQNDSKEADAEPDPGPTLLVDESLSTISVWANILQRFDFIQLMRRQISEAGLDWSPGRLTLAMLLSGTLAMALISRLTWIPGWAAVIAGSALMVMPWLLVLRVRTRRFTRFQEAFPDSLDSMARAMRAGHPLAAALIIVATEAEEPVAGELRRTGREVSLGAPWDRALANLSVRVPLSDVALFVAAVQLQVRSGGKLNEMLSKLAEDMRETVALRGEVRAVAAHGKLTAAILTALPFVIAASMMLVNPSYMAVLFTHPWGKHMIFASLGCLVAAHFVINRLVTIRV